MEQQAKVVPKELRTLSKKIRATNAFVELSQLLRNFSNSLPLVSNLSHPSMRPRHWQLLMETTKVHFGMWELFIDASVTYYYTWLHFANFIFLCRGVF